MESLRESFRQEFLEGTDIKQDPPLQTIDELKRGEPLVSNCLQLACYVLLTFRLSSLDWSVLMYHASISYSFKDA